MKISEEGKLPPELMPGAGQRTHRSQEGALQFNRILNAKSGENRRETLNKLLDEITRQGEVVASKLDIGEVKRYRSLVSDFLDEAVGQTYTSDREGLYDNRGRYKEYALVKKVNVELEKLTQTVLSEQKDNLDVLEQLGIIRGLLVDLMV